MPARPSWISRWSIAATWPLGVALTSWDYMWRTTPLHRRERAAALPAALPELLALPAGVSRKEVQGYEDGCGPLYHRRYRTRVRGARIGTEELMTRLRADPNCVVPTAFARFQLLQGEGGRLTVGDEYVMRMPGPWDGPVRVVDVSPRSFRLATLTGHLEAGQIEFRARPNERGELVFEIESWGRSGSALVHVLYHRLRMAKEIQAHMWISFLEAVVGLAGGRMTGGIEIDTERIELAAPPS